MNRKIFWVIIEATLENSNDQLELQEKLLKDMLKKFDQKQLNTFQNIAEDFINNLFFDEFFTVLILVDVVILLISFFYTHHFHKIIRNSGFVISTILIRISFGVSGYISTILIVMAVLFGLGIIAIQNKYEKLRD